MYRMICIIDQACSQESWILAIAHCIFMDRDEVKVNKNAKKNKGDIQRHNQRSLVNKGFVIWPNGGLFLSGQDRPTRVANQNTGFASSCASADSAIL